MGKLEMSIYITNALYPWEINRKGLHDKSVTADHWKVKDLMKKSKSTLQDLYIMAEKANRS